MKKYLLNSPVLAVPGLYDYKDADVAEIALFAVDTVSAIGHPGTAEVMTQVLGFEVKANRAYITLNPGDMALVFQITERLPEGKVLTAEELKELKYSLRILRRL